MGYALPKSHYETAVSVLGLRDDLHDRLLDHEVFTLKQLDEMLKSGSLVTVPGIMQKRMSEIQRSLDIYCAREYSEFWRFILAVPQLLYYVTAMVSIFFALLLTCEQTFSRDEAGVLLAVFLSMLTFDIGRWAGGSRSRGDTASINHLRALLVFIAASLALALGTTGLWQGQESMRIFLIGLIFGILQAVCVVLDAKLRTKPANPTIPTEDLIEKAIQWFKSQHPEVQGAIVLGLFTCAAAAFSEFGGLCNRLVDRFLT